MALPLIILLYWTILITNPGTFTKHITPISILILLVNLQKKTANGMYATAAQTVIISCNRNAPIPFKTYE